ncbi:MAG: restriction endonuclease subunit S [Candidatus Thiodiazotropha endolucinida]
MPESPQTEYGLICKEFSKESLVNLCVEKIGVQTGPFGSQLHNEDYVDVGTPIITVEHLGDNRILHQNTPFVSDEDKERLSKYHLQEGDIVFSRVGSVDRRALVRQEEDGWLFSGRCLRVRVDRDKIDPIYLSYFFGMDGFKNYIRSIAVGATMPSINTKILSELPIYYPDLDKQRKIAQVLYSIDNKIELNRQTNQTLEQIAQAIFKSWFVDFDPVRAKIAAREAFIQQHPEVTEAAIRAAAGTEGDTLAHAGAKACELAAMCAISGKTEEQLKHLDADTLQQLQIIAALFPDALVESVPDGWVPSTLIEYFNVVMGQSPKGETFNEEGNGMLFFQGRRDFGFRYPTPRVYTTDPKRTAKPGDTLISVRAPVGDRNMVIDNCCLGRGVAAIRHKSGSRSFTYAFIGHIESDLANNGSDGTVFSSINKNELGAVPFMAPHEDLVQHFEELIYPLDQRVEELSKEITSLEILRDYLLPKLLSGELPVDDVT